MRTLRLFDLKPRSKKSPTNGTAPTTVSTATLPIMRASFQEGKPSCFASQTM